MSAASDIVSAIEHGIRTKTPYRVIARNIAFALRSHAEGDYLPLFPEDDTQRSRDALAVLIALADDIEAVTESALASAKERP